MFDHHQSNVIYNKNRIENCCQLRQQHQTLMIQQNNYVQTTDLTAKHIYAINKSTIDKSDFLKRHKTKLKLCHWQTAYRIFMVITILLLALLSDVMVCVAHASDVTSLIRVSDDGEKHSNQKYSDLGITSDPLARDDTAPLNGRNNPALYSLDKIGSNLEMSIAAVFNKVAYGTTTKRSIADNGFVPNLTTVPTPQLTTFR